MTRAIPVTLAVLLLSSPVFTQEPIPDRLVVLTFDDSAKSHYTVARPLLTKYKLGATFFVTEGFDIPTNKKDYMTWDEIAQLHKDGFEIGNHTIDHKGVSEKALADLPAQLRGINSQCKKHGIPQPTSFAYPGNAFAKGALSVLKDNGITFARRGGVPEASDIAGRHAIRHQRPFAHPRPCGGGRIHALSVRKDRRAGGVSARCLSQAGNASGRSRGIQPGLGA